MMIAHVLITRCWSLKKNKIYFNDASWCMLIGGFKMCPWGLVSHSKKLGYLEILKEKKGKSGQ